MTLKELQNMIKEEFAAFQNEAEDEVDVSVNPDADIDAELGDEMGDEVEAEGEEDVLRAIYDLLAAHFGGEGEEEMGDEEMPAIDDVEGEEEEEADIEENATTAAKFQKQGYAAGGEKGGKDAGYGKVGGKGSTGYDASSKNLQERFQKLANIIK